MIPVNPSAAGLLQVATHAQKMAGDAKQERAAAAFRTVAMVSMATMGVTAAAHLIREMLRPDRGRCRE